MNWLLLLHQLPTRPASARIKTWRRLQQLGAIAVRNSAYALPDTPQAREDFEWLKSEIRDMGGHATILSATALDTVTGRELRERFSESRAASYAALREEIESLPARVAPRSVASVRQRLSDLTATDPFDSHERKRAESAVARLGEPASVVAAGPVSSRARAGDEYQGRVWVTRPRPGVDRMASAWLVRSFIDPNARFAFGEKPSGRQIPFDMYDGEFSHHDGLCTFEVMARRFRIDDAAVAHIGRIVHDVDLRDARYGAEQAATVAALVDGLRASYASDEELLERGMGMFEALYRSALTAGSPDPSPRRRSRRPKA